MTYILWALLIYVAWSLAALAFVLYHLGDKYRKDKWYDSIIMAPLFPVFLLDPARRRKK